MSRRFVKLSLETLEERSLPSGSPVIGPLSQPVSNQMLVDVMSFLQTLDKTLINADHDYGGHRAAAVADIGHAEQQLQDALDFVHKKENPIVLPTATGRFVESQKLSNAQLAAAIPVLKSEINILEQADHDYGGHRAKAIQDLKAAELELELALL